MSWTIHLILSGGAPAGLVGAAELAPHETDGRGLVNTSGAARSSTKQALIGALRRTGSSRGAAN